MAKKTRQCKAKNSKGNRCKNPAEPNSDFCRIHNKKRLGGAPKNNQNARLTGEYSKITEDGLTQDERDYIDSFSVDLEKKRELIKALAMANIKERRILVKISEYEAEESKVTEQVTKRSLKGYIRGTDEHNKAQIEYSPHVDETTLYVKKANDDNILKCYAALERIARRKESLISTLQKIEISDVMKGDKLSEFLSGLSLWGENKANMEIDDDEL